MNQSIERIQPVVSIGDLTELVKAAASSKTNELEMAVAETIKWFTCPPFLVNDKYLAEALSRDVMCPGQIIVKEDD